jgi:hypothetical protein
MCGVCNKHGRNECLMPEFFQFTAETVFLQFSFHPDTLVCVFAKDMPSACAIASFKFFSPHKLHST